MKKIRFCHECDFHILFKTFRIMRITVFLLLASMLQTIAGETYSQTTRLSLSFSDTKLEAVLDAIEDRSEFYFLYNQRFIDVDRQITLSVNNERIDKILDQLFAGKDVVY